MVNNRLKTWLEENKLLDPTQLDFRSNRSSTDRLVRLQQEICDGFINDPETLLINFDLKKAVDCIWQYIIFK